MEKFWRDCKGAVTVFVTLLLIPAILISGTAVDLARLYTAKSIVRDANQLAANSLLASYDAMLQDIYGLFGVMQEDETLAAMLNEYIEVTIFGEDWKDKGMGTFQLFYGSGLEPKEPEPGPAQNLANPQILRRQIEEYAKFRAPVVIVKGILDKIDAFQSLKADAEVIEKKIALDAQVGKLETRYEELYELIQEVDAYAVDQDAAFQTVNNLLDQINGQLRALQDTRNEWTWAYDGEDLDSGYQMAECEDRYSDIMDNIRALVRGGRVSTGWSGGTLDMDGLWESGSWGGSVSVEGLEDAARRSATALDAYRKKLEDLVSTAEQIDNQRTSLHAELDALEAALNSGSCSQELKDGMTKKNEQGLSTIDGYRSLIREEVKPMAEVMRNTDTPVIQTAVERLNDLYYGDQSGGAYRISLSELGTLSSRSRGFALDLEVRNRSIQPPDHDVLSQLLTVGSSRYHLVQPEGFLPFAACGEKNANLYAQLQAMYSGEGGAKKKTVEGSITNLLKQAQEKFKGIIIDPEGAHYYQTASRGNTPEGFGSDGDWGKKNEVQEQVQNALKSDLIGQMGGLLNDAGNKILLLTYDTEMLSNYTTKSDSSTMSGVPMSVDVNYFFQSEQEYLYHGDLNDAIANHTAVGGLLMLVRFVFNYVASFNIDEVNMAVNAIKAATATTGPFSVAIGELARLGIVLAESTLDVVNLRSGDEVVLVKTNATWEFSLSGLIRETGEIVLEAGNALMGSSEMPEVAPDNREDGGTHTGVVVPKLSYSDYLRIFLLMKNGDLLADRTAKLIALNMTNKKEDIGDHSDRDAREEAMSQAELFDMSKTITGFQVSTTVNLRMLFLSMPFAQRGLNGVIPPGTLPIQAVEYRGY